MTGNTQQVLMWLFDMDKDAVWDIEPHKEKRRLTQNAYYWVLLEKIAIKTRVPKVKLHNINLRHLGLIERVGERPVYILLEDTEEVEEQTLLATTYHLSPRSETKQGNDGKTYRWYVMLRGSSSFTVSEMQALVELAVQDATAQGIEVLTPNELEHMREIEKEHERRVEKR